jgi:GNAT superfamily N-acetyltransferase
VPSLNGVWVYDQRGEADAVSRLLDRVAATGLPHCLQWCSGCGDDLPEIARARGMSEEVAEPLMALLDPASLPETERTELVITALEPERASVHAELAAAGFEAPVEDFRRLMTPEVLGAPGVSTYVGEVDGEPVATGVGVQLGDHIGVFNVASLPAHRRRGYGAAITGHVVRDGLLHGAAWAWLHSSPAGYGVYQRLGFATLDSWETWIAPG